MKLWDTHYRRTFFEEIWGHATWACNSRRSHLVVMGADETRSVLLMLLMSKPRHFVTVAVTVARNQLWATVAQSWCTTIVHSGLHALPLMQKAAKESISNTRQTSFSFKQPHVFFMCCKVFWDINEEVIDLFFIKPGVFWGWEVDKCIKVIGEQLRDGGLWPSLTFGGFHILPCQLVTPKSPAGLLTHPLYLPL